MIDKFYVMLDDYANFFQRALAIDQRYSILFADADPLEVASPTFYTTAYVLRRPVAPLLDAFLLSPVSRNQAYSTWDDIIYALAEDRYTDEIIAITSSVFPSWHFNHDKEIATIEYLNLCSRAGFGEFHLTEARTGRMRTECYVGTAKDYIGIKGAQAHLHRSYTREDRLGKFESYYLPYRIKAKGIYDTLHRRRSDRRTELPPQVAPIRDALHEMLGDDGRGIDLVFAMAAEARALGIITSKFDIRPCVHLPDRSLQKTRRLPRDAGEMLRMQTMLKELM